MTDEELTARLRSKRQKGNRFDSLEYEAADRIEALTEQLTAAQQDAKEAEAYAEDLEKELNTCRMAQAVMDNTVADLEAKLASGVIAEYDDDSTVFLSGYAGGAAIGGAWSTLTLMEKASDGTLRVREYKAQGDWRATLVEIKGESQNG